MNTVLDFLINTGMLYQIYASNCTFIQYDDELDARGHHSHDQ
jgi:hypothetical protein